MVESYVISTPPYDKISYDFSYYLLGFIKTVWPCEIKKR